MRFPHILLGFCVGFAVFSTAGAAQDCKADDPFVCLSDHVEAEIERLSLTLDKDHEVTFKSLKGFSIYREKGVEAAVKQWEADGLKVYDLVLSLLLAGQDEDAEAAAKAAKKTFALDANSKKIKGLEGLNQVREDVKAYYHGEEDGVYARACVSDEAFKDLIGGSAEMRIGACRAPHDPRAVQRSFGMMQLLKGVSRDDAVDATLQYAYRVPSCTVAKAIIEVAPSGTALSEFSDSAAWKVLDMATVCAAELLVGRDL